MPYFDAEGVEVEGLMTQDDLDAKLEEQKTANDTATTATNEASNEKIIAAEAAKTAAETALEAATKPEDKKEDDKDANLVALRQKLDETNNTLAEYKTNNENEQKSQITKAIKLAAGDDEDLAVKIQHNYDTMLSGVTANTSDEIAQKIASAARLSQDPAETPSAMDIARAGASRGAAPVINQGSPNPFSKAAVTVGNSLGISDADREKYGSDPRLKLK